MKQIIYIFIAVFVVSCNQSNDQVSKDYLEKHKEWKNDRDKRLRADDGFVNLVGLYWLKEGENTIGSGAGNSIVFPEKAPSKIGSLYLKDSTVIFQCVEGLEVEIDSFCINAGIVYSKARDIESVQNHEDYEWYIIERAGNFGIRLRDLKHPLTAKPLNIPAYPVSKKWLVNAKYNKFATPKKLNIDNIIGFSFEEEIEGELVFEIDGKQYTLLPSMGEKNMFIMFADETSGEDTYGSGRYIIVDLPDANGNVTIDFNKSYNPPCAFTEFATCPLPPEENILSLSVEAGEKAWH